MAREYFIFQRNYYEVLKGLANEQRLKIYDAICEFSLEKTETQMDGVCGAVFSLIKPYISRDIKQYENGRKGGRPRTKTKPNENPNETQTKPKCNPNVTQEETTSPLKEKRSKKEIINPLVQEEPPFFISPQGDKKNSSEEEFYSLYPRYAKDRDKMRTDVDYKRLVEEFGKSSYLRSLYTVKQINDIYALIVQGDYRDKENPLAGFEERANRDRWYSERRAKAESEADAILKRFMQDERFKGVYKRLKTLECEIGKAEAKTESGDLKAGKQLVKLTQEQSRLRMEYIGIIERNGKQEEDLFPKWHCALCEDTGYLKDGTACDCYDKEKKEWKIC